jgi:hypothetical protein
MAPPKNNCPSPADPLDLALPGRRCGCESRTAGAAPFAQFRLRDRSAYGFPQSFMGKLMKNGANLLRALKSRHAGVARHPIRRVGHEAAKDVSHAVTARPPRGRHRTPTANRRDRLRGPNSFGPCPWRLLPHRRGFFSRAASSLSGPLPSRRACDYSLCRRNLAVAALITRRVSPRVPSTYGSGSCTTRPLLPGRNSCEPLP